MGDSSDNIPCVPGVGVKRATNLLKEYQTLDNIYDNLDKITAKKLNENLTNHKDDAYLSYDLATIKRDSPIEISLEDLNYSDRKSTRLNSSHVAISYAVFCLKKKT